MSRLLGAERRHQRPTGLAQLLGVAVRLANRCSACRGVASTARSAQRGPPPCVAVRPRRVRPAVALGVARPRARTSRADASLATRVPASSMRCMVQFLAADSLLRVRRAPTAPAVRAAARFRGIAQCSQRCISVASRGGQRCRCDSLRPRQPRAGPRDRPHQGLRQLRAGRHAGLLLLGLRRQSAGLRAQLGEQVTHALQVAFSLRQLGLRLLAGAAGACGCRRPPRTAAGAPRDAAPAPGRPCPGR